MPANWKRYRDLAIVAVLLAVPFFFLRANLKAPESQNPMDQAILRISDPVQRIVAKIAWGFSHLVQDYVYLVDVKQDNQRLSYDNSRLREQIHQLERMRSENQELRRLLQLKETLPADAVSAQVVGKDFTEFFRVTRVVLDRGGAGIREHTPVVSTEGVVGAVLKVAGDSVDVQLAVDAKFGIDVEDERTKARGFVRGTGDPARYHCRVEMVDSRDEVELGDLLVTSGKGKWFPRGIPVARVTKVVKRQLGRDQEIEASPTVDFSRLENVLILVNVPGEEFGIAPTPAPGASARPRGR